MEDDQPRRSRPRRTHRGRKKAALPPKPSVLQQVGLALRADRRSRGQSQRAYAADRALSRDRLARAEIDAGGFTLAAIVGLLAGTDYEIAILPVDSDRPDPRWDLTDLVARTRVGGRFPPHRKVKETPWGPAWWDYHERMGSRGFGPKPKWSAEGFTPPPGTRYGKIPTPSEDGKPRWPYYTPHKDLPDKDLPADPGPGHISGGGLG